MESSKFEGFSLSPFYVLAQLFPFSTSHVLYTSNYRGIYNYCNVWGNYLNYIFYIFTWYIVKPIYVDVFQVFYYLHHGGNVRWLRPEQLSVTFVDEVLWSWMWFSSYFLKGIVTKLRKVVVEACSLWSIDLRIFLFLLPFVRPFMMF